MNSRERERVREGGGGREWSHKSNEEKYIKGNRKVSRNRKRKRKMKNKMKEEDRDELN